MGVEGLNRDEFLDAHVRPRRSPLWIFWCLFFPGADLHTCVILLHGVLYIPAGKTHAELGPDVAYHERIHYRQQLRHGWLWWWVKYRCSRAFRLEQETEAFKAQYRFGIQIMPDFRGRTIYLHDLAEGMAGPTYGLGINKAEAMALIYPKG